MSARRLVLSVLAVAFGVMAFGSVPALAAAPETPVVQEAKWVIATTATLNGELRPGAERYTPEGEEYPPEPPGHYEFLYRASATECTGTGQKAAPVPAGVAYGYAQEQVSVKLKGLQPDTEYAFCLLVRNEAGEVSIPSAPVTFTTASQSEPVIEETYATEVASLSAKLSAKIDPDGAETDYRFEYGTGAGYQPVPGGEGIIAEGATGVLVSVRMQEGLAPGSTYHYRVVASNTLGSVPGPDQTFTTETMGEEFALPDGRAYELVSPPQKDGAEIVGIGGEMHTPSAGGATQASEDGTSVTYIATAPIGANPPGHLFSTLMFSTRGAGGWSSEDISLPHLHATELDNVNAGEEYLRFSSDLSRAVLVPVHRTLEPSLAPEVHQEVAGSQEIYLRDNLTEAFQALDTSEPLPPPVANSERQPIAFEGGSPDLSHLVFRGPAGLDLKYPAAGELYEWFGGRVHLVSVLPNGEPTSGLLGGATEDGFEIMHEGSSVVERHAVSSDGKRVFWTSGGETYMRDTATEETISISGAFLTASSDGSRVFTTEGGNVYMFDVAGRKLTNLTPQSNGEQVRTFYGANEEGTSIYLASPAVLTEAQNSQGLTAQAGASNVYLLREAPAGSGNWSTTFITAGAEDGPSEQVSNRAPFVKQTARVSPNGGFLAFMSRESLTGYDNHDANSGQPDEEVYLYDAEANKLVCASCDPTGARPAGEFSGRTTGGVFLAGQVPMDPWSMWHEHWLAASIPGWTPDGASNTTGYQPRYLNDSGRLFFDSVDALVPRDVNGREDVYEYEPAGVGSCRPPSYGQGASVVFNRTLGGCVALISAGTGNSDSVFVDASASGNDVFFATQDGLAQNDRDGAGDMYDARVCTQTETCPSSFAVSPACTTTDSCRVAPSPQPGVFAAPATATFAGAGNVTPAPTVAKSTTKAKGAGQIRVEKLSSALRACRKRSGRGRAVCEARARKRYGKVKTSGRRIK